ncbi:ABC transporter substrate-binding protein [Kaistia dalseonensis]|uniref:Iron complex transport system substrate-binding protein n=1 Tax=Kaistia dalseonensis TaxID=410840 RepID=A0ABU0H788_9HYPH|nr:ABC transporter substrate-binding protein [Kaistia dalseonensis]MCX5495068.1 ABC transporter substrate-binding protein [Kaistia dalseonensis]MDQ0437650.1 iron complex transport system substrate-binding protein [Kaistia dalseonensis]
MLAQQHLHFGMPYPFELLMRRRSQIALGLAFAVAITLGAIAQSSAAERTIRDGAGREVTVGDAKRIVSIGGAVTEIIYALGAGDRVIARDSTSFYPAEVTQKPDVGYMRALSAEGVLSVKPDLIIAVDGAGPKEAIELLEAAAVPMVVVPEHYSAAGIVEKVTLVADVLGEQEKGKALATRIESQFATLDAALAKIPADQRKKAVFLMSLASDKPLAAGSGTAGNAIIGLAGAINPMAGIPGYKPASDEALAAAQPASIIMMNRPGADAPDADKIFAVPALAATPAAASKALIVMDGLYLLGFGPRTADAARDLAHQIYPSLTLPESSAAK